MVTVRHATQVSGVNNPDYPVSKNAWNEDHVIEGIETSDVSGLDDALAGKAAVSHSHAISDVTGLQTALDAKVADSDIRGGAASASARLVTLGTYMPSNGGGYVSGRYYDNAVLAGNPAATSYSADTVRAVSFSVPVPVAIDQIWILVSTLAAGGNARVGIYSTGSDGFPNALLLGTGNLDISSTGFKSESVTFTFQPGVLYWLAFHNSATVSIQANNLNYTPTYGLQSSTATNRQSAVSCSVSYASGLPDPFGTITYINATASPGIRFRVA